MLRTRSTKAIPRKPTIDFKGTLQKASGAYYSFYTGGFTGYTAISVQSYGVTAIRPTATRLNYGCELFLVYEPDQASSDPPVSADLRCRRGQLRRCRYVAAADARAPLLLVRFSVGWRAGA
ncbi:MAG: hypothetical protein ACLP50_14370 [Solirubrobacteraceae bacterium]